jgi:hypothetical protein
MGTAYAAALSPGEKVLSSDWNAALQYCNSLCGNKDCGLYGRTQLLPSDDMCLADDERIDQLKGIPKVCRALTIAPRTACSCAAWP